METTPAPPSHVRLDDQFGIEKFESFLKSNDPKESKAVFAGKSNKAVSFCTACLLSQTAN
jgi:hypothetical protein